MAKATHRRLTCALVAHKQKSSDNALRRLSDECARAEIERDSALRDAQRWRSIAQDLYRELGEAKAEVAQLKAHRRPWWRWWV